MRNDEDKVCGGNICNFCSEWDSTLCAASNLQGLLKVSDYLLPVFVCVLVDCECAIKWLMGSERYCFRSSIAVIRGMNLVLSLVNHATCTAPLLDRE